MDNLAQEWEHAYTLRFDYMNHVPLVPVLVGSAAFCGDLKDTKAGARRTGM